MQLKTKQKSLFILDTNVLMDDPSSIFRFNEHDVYLPMVVLEELDAGKKGTSEVSRNVRQVSRFLDDLLTQNPECSVTSGIPLSRVFTSRGENQPSSGFLFFQTQLLENHLPNTLAGMKADNQILNTALVLQKNQPDSQVILVSKDINLRIKASALGIQTEDYHNDKVLDDVDLLYKGSLVLTDDLVPSKEGLSIVEHASVADWYPNQCVYQDNNIASEGLVKTIEGQRATVQSATNYRQSQHAVWGINARNVEQNFALNMLMDPEIDFVTLLGLAGSGKTLLALAAGLVQTLDSKQYKEIIVTRATVPLGDDIGFLPGTEEEKMTPWMGALMDNLEVLEPEQNGQSGEWGRAVTADLINAHIKIRSLNFMRGRTFLNRYIILDEAQNLTAKQMKALITRAGPGTKIVCLGNISQIDTPYLSETTSGLTYVVDRFKHWGFSGHITLQRGERSRLADFAANKL